MPSLPPSLPPALARSPAKIQVYISPLAIARAKLARKPHDVLLSAGQRRDIDAANAVYDDRRSLERWLRDAIAAVEEEKDKCGLEDEDEDEEEGSEGDEEDESE